MRNDHFYTRAKYLLWGVTTALAMNACSPQIRSPSSVSSGLVSELAVTLSGQSSYIFTVGQSVTVLAQVTGAPVSFSVSPVLPAGLQLDASNGMISGFATAPSSSQIYTLSAIDSSGKTVSLPITIAVYPAALISYSGSPFIYTTGDAVSIVPATVSGTITISPALTNGLSLNATTGVISGNVTTTLAQTTYTVTSTNSLAQTVNAVITIQIVAPPVVAYAASPYSLKVGIVASLTPSILTSVSSVSILPAPSAGLSINGATGVISGTPTALSAQTTYTITVVNLAGKTASTTLQITVNPGNVASLQFTANPSGTVNTGVVFTTQPQVTLYDVQGDVVTTDSTGSVTLTPFTDVACTVAGTGTLAGNLATASSGVATFSGVDYNKAAAPLYMKATLGSLTVCSAGVTVQVVANTLAITAATSAATPIIASCAGPYTVTQTDSYGNTPTASSALTVNLSYSGTGTFYTDSGCGTSETSATIAANAGTVQFYLKDTTFEGAVRTITASGLTTNGTYNVTLTANAVITAGPVSFTAGACVGPFTVQLRDYNSNPVTVSAATTIGLGGFAQSNFSPEFTSGVFQNAGCSGTIFQVASGANSMSFYYRQTRTDLSYVKVNATTYVAQSSNYNLTVTAGSASQIILTGPSFTSSGTCAGPYTLTLLDANQNVATASSNESLLVTLSGAAATAHAASDCSDGSAASYAITSASSTVQFYLEPSASGTVTVSSTDSAAVLTASNSFQINSSVSAPVIGLATAENHSCAVLNGVIKCWGHNTSGQLGNGANVSTKVPVAVTNVPAGTIMALQSGRDFTCALIQNAGVGEVYCWGTNSNGQLGIGSAVASENTITTAVQYYDGTNHATLTHVTAISLGLYAACALDSNQHVWCWGWGTSALGSTLGSANSNLYALEVNSQTGTAGSYLSGIDLVAVGDVSICAADSSNQLWCWGSNGGAVGNNSFTAVPYPTAISFTGAITSISSGGSHTCATNSAGALYCWGYGAFGALGNGTSGTLAVPTQVKTSGAANLSGVASVVAFGNKSANGTSTCALTTAGAVYCWGSNSFGQVGANGTESASTYTYAYPLPSLTSGVLSLSAVSGCLRAALQ